jgi:hypothetical protein
MLTNETTASRKIAIRDARLGDIGWLTGQFRCFAEFFATKHNLMPDEQYVEERLPALIRRGPFFVAEVDEFYPIGFVSGVIAPHAYNPDLRLLHEQFWWVDVAWRGSRAGLLLLNAFNDYGDAHADWVLFGLEEKSPVNPRTLEKRGFHLHERSYLREVDHG